MFGLHICTEAQHDSPGIILIPQRPFVQVLEGPASMLVDVQTQQEGAMGEMAFRLLTLRKGILDTEVVAY
jgi:hypothetical protein